MNNAATISAVNRALAHYRRRQAYAPTDHSAREIVQLSMLAEYLHESHTPEVTQKAEPHSEAVFDSVAAALAA